MDLQEELLLFLHSNKANLEYVKINSILQNHDIKLGNIKVLLEELQNQKIVSLQGELSYLGGNINGVSRTLNNTTIKARLTSVIGENYVIEKYLKQKERDKILETKPKNEVVKREMSIETLKKLKNEYNLEYHKHHVYNCDDCKQYGTPKQILEYYSKREIGYIKEFTELNFITDVAFHEHQLACYLEIARENNIHLDLENQSFNLKKKQANNIKTKLVSIWNAITTHPVISTLISAFIIWLIYSYLKSHNYIVLGFPIE